MNGFKKIISLLNFRIIKKEEYIQIKEEISITNRKRVLYYSSIGAIIFGILTAGTYSFEILVKGRYMYFSMFVCLVLIDILGYFVMRKKESLSIVFVYILILLGLAFSIYMGTFYRPDLNATAFFVLLVAAPLLTVERPGRMSVILVIATLVFRYCVYISKSPEIALVDEMNTIIFLLLSIIVNVNMQNVKMREMIEKHTIEHERDTDELTGILTKSAFELQVRQYLQGENNTGFLLMMDLDDFKYINDTYGHTIADDVLRTVGKCLRTNFRSSDIKGRFGGDEFTVFLKDADNNKGITNRIERYMQAIEKIQLFDSDYHIHCSVGIVHVVQGETDYDIIFQKADAALYSAKRSGKNQYSFYSEEN